MILVTNANSNTCRFYTYDKKLAQMTLIKELSHPENKLKNSDLVADKSGRYMARDIASGAYSPHMDTKDIDIDNFAREIAEELDERRKQNGHEQFILVAEPRMSGRIVGHLNKHVQELIINTIHKDLINLSARELLAVLKSAAFYPDK